MAILRDLVRADPRYLRSLAGALTVFGNLLARAGKPHGAAAVARELDDIQRELG